MLITAGCEKKSGNVIITPEENQNNHETEEVDKTFISNKETEFYTYEEYLEFQENQKALLFSLIDCIDENWMPFAGASVLTQEMYDEAIANWDNNTLYQETLVAIQNGAQIPKLPGHSYPYAVYDTLDKYLDLKCHIDNGKWILYNEDNTVILEIFETKEAMLERARWYLHRGALAGQVDMAQANTVYRNLYGSNG